MKVVVRNLSKAYGLFWALKDTGFELQTGECVALLGPNGAGKTTLLKLLSALLYPTTGEIIFDGEKLSHDASRLRSSVGLFLPHEHFYENLTAIENLRFFISLYRKEKDIQELENTLDAVGIRNWSNDYVSSLSNGMKCRLAIAKWLLLEPDLLLLDEPYGVLDENGVNLLNNFLRKLCQKGAIVVIATHQIHRVLSLCSRAIILQQGKVTFDEPRQEPWANFQRAFGELLPRADQWNS